MNKSRVIGRRVVTALLGLAAAGLVEGALAQSALPSADDPFVKDAAAGYNARTFYMDVDEPGGRSREAWAFGGKVYGRTGYWNEMLQFGASYYFSLPLYAPEDKDGTRLLAPGQESISVLGEAYARLRFEPATLTLGRQEIDMGYKRPSGVRGNRSDLTYVGRLDNRMVPVTYEAVLLGGASGESLNYYAGWINKAKPRQLEDFQSVGNAVGAKGSDSDMWMGGVQYAPMKDFWIQGWYHSVSDVIRIAYLDADYVLRLSNTSHLRFAGQYTDQRSDGSNALTGQPFETSNAQAYGEYRMERLTFYGAYTRTGSGADIRLPFSSGPIYTQQLTRTFVRAHEQAWQLGVGADFGAWVPGLSGWVDYTGGRDAINASTGANLPDEEEIDVGIVWTLRQKGSFVDGMRTRFRYGWVTDKEPTGNEKTTDLRLDINLPIKFL